MNAATSVANIGQEQSTARTRERNGDLDSGTDASGSATDVAMACHDQPNGATNNASREVISSWPKRQA